MESRCKLNSSVTLDQNLCTAFARAINIAYPEAARVATDAALGVDLEPEAERVGGEEPAEHPGGSPLLRGRRRGPAAGRRRHRGRRREEKEKQE